MKRLNDDGFVSSMVTKIVDVVDNHNISDLSVNEVDLVCQVFVLLAKQYDTLKVYKNLDSIIKVILKVSVY